MHARHRSALIIGILALGLFIARWPLENQICDPNSWGYTNEKGQWVSFRPPVSEGENFFTIIFHGGSGTPAIFAMLGGQRYVVANIIWNYADVLFHQGHPEKMMDSFEAVVTLNPSFTEAWSVYGWHDAWNMYAYVQGDPALQAKWLDAGEAVYKRAIVANPLKPKPYWDIAWLYLERKGDYKAAIEQWEKVVNHRDVFKPITIHDIQKQDDILERFWVPIIYANRLGYAYKKLAIINWDNALLQKAIDAYRLGYQLDPEGDKIALQIAKELEKGRTDPKWWRDQQLDEQKNRDRFGLPPVDFGKPFDIRIQPKE